jgi:glycosyltransferase involved in cell wall biosynthesis
MPKVSVVMCVYNHDKFVGETIESVIEQTYQDWEFIITNDGSTDGSLDIIKQYDDPRIKLFSLEKNSGARVARNNSIKHARGEYIAVINSDDVWTLNKLEKQVKFLDKNPDIGAVFTYAAFINDDSEDIGYEHHYGLIFNQPNRSRLEWLRHFFLAGNCLCHPSVLIRKVCHEDLGLYDERLGQLADFDMWVRLVTKYQIHILPENLVKFRLLKNQGNISGNTPKNNSRVILEWSQVLRNYLKPEILDNLHQIFDLKTNINEVGLSVKQQPFSRDIAPFFVAMLASKSQNPGHQYFCFDQLYQMLADQELAQKLEDQYYFNFSSLTDLAREQDIFGIVALDRVQSQLVQNQEELAQSQAQLHQIQAELADAQAQQHQTGEVLEQLNSQLHQTQQELELSNSQLHQAQQELELSNTQLHQAQQELELSNTQLHQTQQELELSNTQLHQAQQELELSNTQLHQAQQELELSNTQLHQAQQELELSNTQLHQAQQQLELSKSQLHQAQQELEQTQLQSHQTEAVLEQSQSQLHQMEAVLEQSQSQFHQMEAVLEQSQSQLHQMEAVVEQSQSQFHQTQRELKETQLQLHATQLELNFTNTQLDQTQRELEHTNAQLHQIQRELEHTNTQLHLRDRKWERDQFQKTLAHEPIQESQMQYELLVWDAWYAYQNENLIQMQECLKQSLKCTPFSPTETVLKWIESFSKLALKNGEGFDAKSLTNSAEWKQLMSRVVVAKPMSYRS